jgi:hypothetical protein
VAILARNLELDGHELAELMVEAIRTDPALVRTTP